MSTTFKSLLFVPGSRPERFDKAAASGADTIIIDLEDAVLPENKSDARAASLGWLAHRGGQKAGIRINSPRTSDGCADIAALAVSGCTPDFVMVPKAETGVDMEIVGDALGHGAELIAVIESGRGLRRAFDIAKQSSAGVLFGGADYSAILGADLSNWDAMIVARGTIAGACGAAGVPAYDVPFLDVKDPAGLEATTRQAKAMGFAGRACIHPNQVDTVNTVFLPTPAEVLEARAIIKALEDSQGGAALHNGKLIDRPVVLAAHRTLAKAGEERG
ncbi:MAG: CoA ester lyase [Henriciella sp.]|nr:CoA ester lyase [Henriciella sp.]